MPPKKLNMKAVRLITAAFERRNMLIAQANAEFTDVLESYEMPLDFSIDNYGKVTVPEPEPAEDPNAAFTNRPDPEKWTPNYDTPTPLPLED